MNHPLEVLPLVWKSLQFPQLPSQSPPNQSEVVLNPKGHLEAAAVEIWGWGLERSHADVAPPVGIVLGYRLLCDHTILMQNQILLQR